MAINVNLVTSRNQLPKYTYFLVRSNTGKIHSQLPLQEYMMFVFTNPVTETRGISILTNSYTQEIAPITDELFPIGTFSHPKYTNQNKKPLTFLYRDIEQTIIPITASRTENIITNAVPKKL